MKKSILRFGALALMSMMSIGVFAFEAVDKQGTYTPNGDGTVTLTKANSGNTDAGKVVYQTVKDSEGHVYTVTAIGSNAFKNATGSKVTQVTSVASSVKTVADYAFADVTNLTITLSQLESIGQFAFQGVAFAENGTAVTAPVEINASSIGKGAFKGTSLVAVKWGANKAPTTVPEECFAGCLALTAFEFGRIIEGLDYVTKIGEGAFSNCTSLVNFGWLNTSASEYCLPTTLERIEKNAFNGCTVLADLKFSDQAQPNIAYVGPYAFQSSGLTSDSFNKIFTNKDEGDIEFAEHAFSGVVNVNFTNIVLPKNVKLGKETFSGSTSLTAVTFQGLKGELSEGCFSGCGALTTLNDFNKLKITYIPKKAFLNSGITAIAFPSTVTTIGEQAFDGCSALYAASTLTLPEGITLISKQAFANTTFKTLNLPASLSSANGTATIGEKAFYGNTSIAVINLKGSNANVDIFKPADKIYCSSLDDTFAATVYTSATLNVPYGCYEIYTDQSTAGTPAQKVNKTWYNFTVANVSTPVAKYATDDVFFVDGLGYKVTKNDGQGVATVKVVDGRFAISSAALNQKTENTSANVRFNETTKDIKNVTLVGTAITIPQYVTTNLDKYETSNAYYKVTELEGVNTVDITSIADYNKAVKAAIANVESVVVKAKSIALPKCFNAESSVGFTGLKSFTTADGGSIAQLSSTSVFYNSKKLETVNFVADPTFTSILGSTFQDCISLKSFEIPASVTSIRSYAFYNSGIESIELPSALTTIEEGAFGKTPLTEINIPENVTTIGSNAFKFDYDADAKKEIGVKDVYVNWEDSIPAGIDNLAFDPERHETKNDKTIYHLRNLHYPAGQKAVYTGYTLFQEAAHIFNTLEGIKVNGKNVYMTSSEDLYGDPSIVLEDKVDGKGVESVVIARNLDANVTYRRTIADANVWQCWYVPFDVVAGEVEGATFAMLADTKVDGENVTIELQNVPAGKTVKANTCYVVKFAEAGGKEITASGLYATVENSHAVSCASTVFTFKGLYNKATAASNSDFYIVNAKGGFQFLGKDKNVYAYRFKMTPSDNPTNPYLVKFVDIDDDATAIENVKANSLNAPMFDVMGRQIVAPAKGQVYIQNGVKKLAK